MGYFIPTFLAFILNSCGVYIFHESTKPGCEPLVSCLIFLFSVFLLLWDIRLFPYSLRRLWRCGSYLVQFLVAAFLMEHIMNDFWFPLEASLFAFLPRIAQFEEDIGKQSGWECPGMFQFLKTDLANVISSYALSLFFFVAVLHATRVVDVRLLRCGLHSFTDDLKYRSKQFMRRLRKIFIKQKKVSFQNSHRFKKNHCDDCLFKRYLTDDDKDNDDDDDDDICATSSRCRNRSRY